MPIRITKYAAYQSSRTSRRADLVDRCRGRSTARSRSGFERCSRRSARTSTASGTGPTSRVDAGRRPGPHASRRCAGTSSSSPRRRGGPRARASRQGPDRAGLRRPLLLGHRDLRAAVPLLHPAAHRPEPAAVPPQHAAQGARAGGRAGPARRPVPLADDQRRRGSAYYQAGTAQYHLNADIAYAIRRYVDVRGDIGFLVEAGAEILVETARLWDDLGFYADDGAFHIHGVTGPDEYTTVVNDNAFTNLMARLNLRYAADASARLAGRAPGRLRRARRTSVELRARGARGVGAGGRPHVRPVRRRARHQPAGRHVPRPRALGPRRHAARDSRCCCTTTRWSSTGAR